MANVIKTTLFGKALIDAAEEVLQVEYRAGNNNQYGEKLEQIVQEYDLNPIGGKKFTGRGKKQLDYCGITASVIIDRAVRKYTGQTNKFKSASASFFKNSASKHKLRVDNTPTPGCLFLVRRDGGSGYHVGFVWDVNPDGSIKTIEGNTYGSSSFHVRKDGCKIKLNPTEYGILSKARRPSKIDCFVHVEEMFDSDIVEIQRSTAMLADEPPTEGTYCNTEPTDPDADGGEAINNADLVLGYPKDKVYIAGGIAAVLLAIGIAMYKEGNLNE